MQRLKGKKTYIVAFFMVMIALVNLSEGETTLIEIVNEPYFILLLEGMGIASIRHAIG